MKTEHGYIGRTAAPETDQRFGAVVVAALMRDGLATSNAFDERLVVLTNAATALFDFQHTNTEVGS
nr:N-acetylglucosamine-6-phosphate deacetylase [Xanthomonas axonopodis]